MNDVMYIRSQSPTSMADSICERSLLVSSVKHLKEVLFHGRIGEFGDKFPMGFVHEHVGRFYVGGHLEVG